MSKAGCSSIGEIDHQVGYGVDRPARCAELAGLTVIRAVRLEAGSDPLAAARRWLAEAATLGAAPDLVIIDVSPAWDAGHLLPRLDLPDDAGEPPACQNCDVKEACVRGDSGVRQRMLRWLDDERHAAEPSPAARIFALAGAQP